MTFASVAADAARVRNLGAIGAFTGAGTAAARLEGHLDVEAFVCASD